MSLEESEDGQSEITSDRFMTRTSSDLVLFFFDSNKSNITATSFLIRNFLVHPIHPNFLHKSKFNAPRMHERIEHEKYDIADVSLVKYFIATEA